MKLGEMTLSPVVETDDVAFPADGFFDARPTLEIDDPDGFVAQQYDAARHALLLSHHAWLVDTGEHKVLIDPCAGNHKPRPLLPAYDMLDLPWIPRLAAAGAAPEEIDYVFCTHLHADHCGWNTRLVDGAWVPTFPRARYLFSATELAFWSQEASGALPAAVAYNGGVYTDSVQPVLDAGQEMIVDGPMRLGAISIEPAPGHTPGHLNAVLETTGAGVVFAGDVLHHPLQVAHPDWNTRGCLDPAQARLTRRKVLATCADRGYLLAPAHFRAPYVFGVERSGATFALAGARPGHTPDD